MLRKYYDITFYKCERILIKLILYFISIYFYKFTSYILEQNILVTGKIFSHVANFTKVYVYIKVYKNLIFIGQIFNFLTVGSN